ncbi:hypothetical protein [Pseudodesulfovibrio sediminis]|uniref:Periplasmic heavy metal sensor n=1 Tax=Pseudodesulfovibrio sediminis TaxID=2810563 RepID=A0ABN6ESQ8_9BACT|nr:hypothetical protein [Pseudodesulfovibrio sediminis]BCS88235.1 hypothetical protein PSDVSF_14770 [Pseudodesulfovibrio sediminis]
MKKWKIWAAVVSVFTAGVLVGAVGLGVTLRYHMAPPKSRAEFQARISEELMERIVKHVRPDPSAIPDIKAVILQTMAELQALRGEIEPRHKAIIETGNARIKALLSTEQQARFDKITEDIKKGRFSLFRPPPPPPF